MDQKNENHKEHHQIVKVKVNKRIALVAHDNRKKDLLNWAYENREVLSRHQLVGTGTTGHLLEQKCGLQVHRYRSGPLGGDQQIGAEICENRIDILIFFWDPLTAQPHDPDVKALLRLSVLYNIPTACNLATADFMVSSGFFDAEFEKKLVDYASRRPPVKLD